MSTELALLSAVELLRRYADRSLSPIEVVDAVLDRIEALNPKLNAFCLVDAESARASARASEARWRSGKPLGLVDGVPTSVKDMFLTRGWPTLRGSKTIPVEGPWTEDSPLVAHLRAHGAVFLGKTTQPEFGWKGVTDSPIHGVTRNPWNPERTPGGSSGGAGVAAATGMGALHAGGDGGGSIRIPAAFCGVYGLKPSFGRVPNWPSKMPGTITHAGPMTRTVADAALMLTVMAEPDSRDWLSLPPDRRDYRQRLEDGLSGLRIAYSATLGHAKVDPEVARLVREAVNVFAEAGAVLEEADPGIDDPQPAFQVYYFVRFARLCAQLTPAQRKLLDPGIPEMAEIGARYTAIEVLDAEAQRDELAFRMNAFLGRYDLLLTPQMPIAAFAAGAEYPVGQGYKRWLDWSPFTYPFNFTQQPAASVPCGFTRDSMPVALQIVGPRHRDDLVLRASRAFERACPFAMPPA